MIISKAFLTLGLTSLTFQTATLLDLVPALGRLPKVVLSIQKEAREIHQRELKLFRNLFLRAREGPKDGTAKVRVTETDRKINRYSRIITRLLCRPHQDAERRRIF